MLGFCSLALWSCSTAPFDQKTEDNVNQERGLDKAQESKQKAAQEVGENEQSKSIFLEVHNAPMLKTIDRPQTKIVKASGAEKAKSTDKNTSGNPIDQKIDKSDKIDHKKTSKKTLAVRSEIKARKNSADDVKRESLYQNQSIKEGDEADSVKRESKKNIDIEVDLKIPPVNSSKVTKTDLYIAKELPDIEPVLSDKNKEEAKEGNQKPDKKEDEYSIDIDASINPSLGNSDSLDISTQAKVNTVDEPLIEAEKQSAITDTDLKFSLSDSNTEFTPKSISFIDQGSEGNAVNPSANKIKTDVVNTSLLEGADAKDNESNNTLEVVINEDNLSQDIKSQKSTYGEDDTLNNNMKIYENRNRNRDGNKNTSINSDTKGNVKKEVVKTTPSVFPLEIAGPDITTVAANENNDNSDREESATNGVSDIVINYDEKVSNEKVVSSFVVIQEGQLVEKIPATKVNEQLVKQSLLDVLLLNWQMQVPTENQKQDERFFYCFDILGEMRKGHYHSFSSYTVNPDDYNRWRQRLGDISLVQLYDQPLTFYRLEKQENTINIVQTVFETDERLSKLLLGYRKKEHFFSGIIAFDNDKQLSQGGIGRFHTKKYLDFIEWHVFEWGERYYGLRLKKEEAGYSELEIIPLLYTEQDRQRNCRWNIL